MKGIIKNVEPQEFTAWKAEKSDDWAPNWDDFRNPQKDTVKTSLLEEQGYICCYCCKRIEKEKTTSIEHFKPRNSVQKDLFKEYRLDYDNFLACCDGGKKEKIQKHCDKIKENKFYKDGTKQVKFISPTDKDTDGNFICEVCFGFDEQGTIYAKGGFYAEDAEFTINSLALNVMKTNRMNSISFLYEDEETNQFFDFSEEEIAILLTDYSTKKDGKFEPYCDIVIYFLKKFF